jgi:hypothetical protein
MTKLLALSLALVLSTHGPVRAAEPVPSQEAPRVKEFLGETVGFDASQLAALERGEVISRIIEAHGDLNVVLFGAVALSTSRDHFVQQVLDFRNSLRAPTRVQLGLFGTPATDGDVAKLSLTDQDVRDLKDCKPNDCKLKLPGFLMQRARKDIDWSRPDVSRQVNVFCQERVVGYVNEYRAHGDSALVYDNVGSVRASDAFVALLAEAPYVYQVQRPMLEYLKHYPRGRLDGAQETIFWCVDSLKGLKPTLSVNHEVVAPSAQPGVTVIANKQIYTNRYLEAMLDLTAVVDRPTHDGKPRIYLLRLRRLRFDRVPSVGPVSIKGKVRNGMRDQLVSDLERIRAVVAKTGE